MSNTPRGYKITIHVPGGTPDGFKVVEKSGWVGRAIVCPRGDFSSIRKREEFGKTGVYVLLGESNPDELPTIYVGEGDPVGNRLLEHHRHRDFWSVAIFFTSKDETLDKAYVQHLEAQLIKLARDAKRCILDTRVVPTLPSLARADEDEVEAFLAEMLLVYATLGVKVFQKPRPPSKALLYIRRPSFCASGYETPDGFVVRKSSHARPCSRRAPEIVVRWSKQLVKQGVLVREGDHLHFTQDYPFTSPSLAASVVLGRGANGRTVWRDENGRRLKELQEATADQS